MIRLTILTTLASLRAMPCDATCFTESITHSGTNNNRANLLCVRQAKSIYSTTALEATLVTSC